MHTGARFLDQRETYTENEVLTKNQVDRKQSFVVMYTYQAVGAYSANIFSHRLVCPTRIVEHQRMNAHGFFLPFDLFS